MPLKGCKHPCFYSLLHSLQTPPVTPPLPNFPSTHATHPTHALRMEYRIAGARSSLVMAHNWWLYALCLFEFASSQAELNGARRCDSFPPVVCWYCAMSRLYRALLSAQKLCEKRSLRARRRWCESSATSKRCRSEW